MENDPILEKDNLAAFKPVIPAIFGIQFTVFICAGVSGSGKSYSIYEGKQSLVYQISKLLLKSSSKLQI
jgi:hypothetical protein